MDKIETALFDIVSVYLTKEKIEINCDLNDLYNLSNKLNITAIVSLVLNKNGYNNKKFNDSILQSVNQYERYLDVRKQMDILLQNIDYLYLKGNAIAKYYVEPYLRYSGDLDIIVKDRFYEVFEELIRKDYKCITRTKQECTLINKNGITIDLHREFYLNEAKYEKVFINAYNKSHELNDDYQYIYLIIHTYKHISVYGQFEFRPYIDLYYLRDKIDNDKVNSILKDIGLEIFNKRLNHFVDVLIHKEKEDIYDTQLKKYIIMYADDHGAKTRVLINSIGKSKIVYYLSRLFQPYELMKYEYPILEKKRWMLPLYYVVRLFKLIKNIFFSSKQRKKYTINEINNNFKNNTKEKESMEEFIKIFGVEPSGR